MSDYDFRLVITEERSNTKQDRYGLELVCSVGTIRFAYNAWTLEQAQDERLEVFDQLRVSLYGSDMGQEAGQ